MRDDDSPAPKKGSTTQSGWIPEDEPDKFWEPGEEPSDEDWDPVGQIEDDYNPFADE